MPGHDRAAPRHPARRHGACAALRLRRLRVRSGSASGRSRCPRCSTVAWSTCFTHIRGGGKGGRRWWLDGRLTAKQHTFDDHIAVADGLAAAGLVDPDRIATRGLSAGGLLQGAVFSQRPDRWRAVVAEVPFVDVITSMLDDSHPADGHRVGRVGGPTGARAVRRDARLLAVRQPAEAGQPAGPARHRRRPRHPGARARARQVGGAAARDRPRVGRTWAACSVPRLGTGSHVGPSGRLDHLAYEADVAAWLLDRLGVSAPTS